MSDKQKFPFDEEVWDAEKALEKRLEVYRVAEERMNKTQTSKVQRTVGNSSAGATRQPRRRKKKANIRGWLILGAIGAALIALLLGLIFLIVSIFTTDEEPTTALTELTTEATEPTQSDEEIAAEIVVRAERLAASYDYDEAIAALHEFGENWKEQTLLSEAYDRFVQAQSALVRWEDTRTIPHISFRALIVDSKRAFDGDSDELTYNQTMITVNECRAILQELYENDYVLVSMHDMVKTTSAEGDEIPFEQGDIYLPEGKKPIVISQEDVNYYSYRVDGPDDDSLPDANGDGFACQLLLDEQGNLTCKYIDADGNVLFGAYDFVPILEEFVEEHPDFSYRGAKGMLAVTGYEGVFGFRTHPDWEDVLGEEAYMQEIREAQAVSAALKERGWEIASQGYSKISFSNSDADTIAANLKKWDNQVAPIVGKTDILVYPYGSDIGGVNYYSGEKFNVLYNAGYRIFCGMDAAEYWVQLRDNYMRQARRVIDGYRMEYGADRLVDLFDVKDVIDSARPRPIPSL